MVLAYCVLLVVFGEVVLLIATQKLRLLPNTTLGTLELEFPYAML